MGPYWHTTPGLAANGDPSGAMLFEAGDVLETWTDPALRDTIGEV